MGGQVTSRFELVIGQGILFAKCLLEPKLEVMALSSSQSESFISEVMLAV